MNDIVKTIWIDAEPGHVWSYLTDKDKLGDWFQPAEKSLTLGKDYVCYPAPEEKDGARVFGKVLEMEKPDRLVMTFNHAYLNHDTQVTFTLAAKDGGTELVLVHNGFAGAPGDLQKHIDDHNSGWDPHLQDLQEKAAA